MPNKIGKRRPEIACAVCDTKGHINEILIINAQEGGKMISKYHCRLCDESYINDIPTGNGPKEGDMS